MRALRRLTEDVGAAAQTPYRSAAEHDAVVVHAARDGHRAAYGPACRAPVRQAQRAADVATVRRRNGAGRAGAVDFGEKRVAIAGAAVTVFLLVAVLSY